MSTFLRFLSGFVTVLPASMFVWILTSISAGNDYYWKTYFIVGGIFLAASFALGFYLPSLAPVHWKRHPILWFFGLGLLAWLVAIGTLGLFNLTPLCVGQENGDGTNTLGMCMMQSVMVSLVSAPLEFIMLCLSALPGGWLVKRLIKSEGI
jgi:hypothetical protein